MKKLAIITLILFLGFLGNYKTMAQGEDLFSAMEEHLTADEKDQIERAKENLAKGDKMEDQIRQEDSKNQKYMSKKGKKAEKKTVDAKALRIKQIQYYEKGYELIYTVYSEKLTACVFSYPEDEKKVNELVEDAATENASAKRKMKEFKGLNEKDLKKKVEYAKLKSDIQSTISAYNKSIKDLIEGYAVYTDQEAKKQLEEEENRSWQNAESEGTILGYQSYLNDYPSGKYASEARQKIKEIEDKQKREQDEKNRSTAGLKFQVQIAASKVKLSNAKIATFYKAVKEVNVRNYDGWYKYSVGSFNTYKDAKDMVTRIKVKGAFVVAYDKDDKKVVIVDSMKNIK